MPIARFLVLCTLALAAACASPSERHPLGKADGFGSCQTASGDLCGGKSNGNCYCDEDCEAIGDCCEDKVELCGCPAGGCATRRHEVILTEPFCDVCSDADKAALVARSPIAARAIELIDGARSSIEVAQFTFSQKPIGAALERARARGVAVRVALDAGQDKPETLGTALRTAGMEVRFVTGKGSGAEGAAAGLLHSKFLLVDGATLMTGSNNWSSTGVSINEENDIVVHGRADDELIAGFSCHFEALWDGTPDASAACSRGDVAFTPGSGGRTMIRDALRSATTSIDVLMHHLVFDDLVTELAKAAERGVQVRLVVNDEDRAEHAGAKWDRLLAAGGQLRFKRSNDALFQLQHNKLAIIDGRLLVDGSGNWSGSAFFNNYENYVRYDEPEVVDPFRGMFERIWMWSLSGAALDAGQSAADQHVAETGIFLGNLHAHVAASEGARTLDDGNPRRRGADGQPIELGPPAAAGAAAAAAYRYARDQGRMDFLALSPHTTDDDPADQPSQANMSMAGYQALEAAARDVTAESTGFLALASMEWSTNGLGNHVGIFGAGELCKVERGHFDELYDGFLRGLRGAGQHPLLMMNHPKTFRTHAEALEGNWDQIFDTLLTEITNPSEREKKFNDFGLDDYAPLREVLPSWIAGEAMPDRGVVDATLANLWASAAPYLRLIEVTVSRGTELDGESPTNPSLVPGAEPGTLERFTKVHEWEYYLLRGFELAPVASHDNHFANWGTGHTSRTGVIARGLSARGLLDAIDQRQVFASEDDGLEVRLYLDERIPMGAHTATTAAELVGRVFVSDPDFAGPFEVRVRRARRGGAAFETVATIEAAAGWTALALPVPDPGEWIVYLEIVEPGPDRQAWTAPVWIERL